MDWFYAGQKYIGGWAAKGDLAEQGFKDTWGEVQNALALPPFESDTFEVKITLTAPPAGTEMEVKLSLYDLSGELLDTWDSIRHPEMAFTLEPTSFSGAPPADTDGWINTNNPAYTQDDTVIIEFAMPVSNQKTEPFPVYLSSLAQAKIGVYDITDGGKSVKSYTLSSAKERKQTYEIQGETGDKLYSTDPVKDSSPATYYLKLLPSEIGQGLIEGHEYLVTLGEDTGTTDLKLVFDFTDVFTYLGSAKPQVNIETNLKKANTSPKSNLYEEEIGYANAGFVDAYEVVITEKIPEEATYVAGSASPVAKGFNAINPNAVQFFDGVTWSNTEPVDPVSVKSIRWLWEPGVIAANEKQKKHGSPQTKITFPP